MEKEPSRHGIWLFILYPLLSAIVVGISGTVIGLAAGPFWVVKTTFMDNFVDYALRFPANFSILRWIAPLICWGLVLLMLIAVRSKKSIITVFQVRILLLVLLVLISLLIKVLITVTPLDPLPSPHLMTDMAALLLIFVSLDFILVFLATFLPVFKPLRRRLS